MKITATQLRRIIKEEVNSAMNESVAGSAAVEDLAVLIESQYSGLLYDMQATDWSDPRLVRAVQSRISSLVPAALERLSGKS